MIKNTCNITLCSNLQSKSLLLLTYCVFIFLGTFKISHAAEIDKFLANQRFMFGNLNTNQVEIASGQALFQPDGTLITQFLLGAPPLHGKSLRGSWWIKNQQLCFEMKIFSKQLANCGIFNGKGTFTWEDGTHSWFAPVSRAQFPGFEIAITRNITPSDYNKIYKASIPDIEKLIVGNTIGIPSVGGTTMLTYFMMDGTAAFMNYNTKVTSRGRWMINKDTLCLENAVQIDGKTQEICRKLGLRIHSPSVSIMWGQSNEIDWIKAGDAYHIVSKTSKNSLVSELHEEGLVFNTRLAAIAECSNKDIQYSAFIDFFEGRGIVDCQRHSKYANQRTQNCEKRDKTECYGDIFLKPDSFKGITDF